MAEDSSSKPTEKRRPAGLVAMFGKDVMAEMAAKRKSKAESLDEVKEPKEEERTSPVLDTKTERPTEPGRFYDDPLSKETTTLEKVDIIPSARSPAMSDKEETASGDDTATSMVIESPDDEMTTPPEYAEGTANEETSRETDLGATVEKLTEMGIPTCTDIPSSTRTEEEKPEVAGESSEMSEDEDPPHIPKEKETLVAGESFETSEEDPPHTPKEKDTLEEPDSDQGHKETVSDETMIPDMEVGRKLMVLRPPVVTDESDRGDSSTKTESPSEESESDGSHTPPLVTETEADRTEASTKSAIPGQETKSESDEHEKSPSVAESAASKTSEIPREEPKSKSDEPQKDLRTEDKVKLKLNEGYIVVAAIDFGTTFSGYAFSFKSKPDQVVINRNWGSPTGINSLKTPTSVLTNPDGSFNSFGFEAEEEYAQHDPEDDFQIYRCFKMVLHSQNLSIDCTIQSERGEKARAMDIFAMSLRYLKDHMLKSIFQTTKTTLGPHEVRWVLTVPAIWSDEAKNFMRQAAYQAGLIEEPTSPSLLIALEPEAAALFCRTKAVNISAASKFGAGDKLLVIDAGGGTVDITALELLLTGEVKELIPASGGHWGGNKVNENFINFLKKVLGDDFIEHIRKNAPNCWLDFTLMFETTKKNMKIDGANKVRIAIPHPFQAEYKKLKGTDIGEAISTRGKTGVSFGNGYLHIDHSRAMGFFKKSCKSTFDHVEKLLAKPVLASLNYILLVGGYGQSPMLYDACRKAFSEKCKVLVPTDSQSAIIQGAVLYGHQPEIVSIRKAKVTYGYKASLPFDETKHDKSRKIISKRDGKVRCKGAFSEFVKAGEDLKNPEERTLTVHPKSKTEKSTSVAILKSEKNTVLYSDDDGVTELGKIRVKATDGYLGENIQVKIYFGHTELLVEATDLSKESGSAEKAYLSFT